MGSPRQTGARGESTTDGTFQPPRQTKGWETTHDDVDPKLPGKPKGQGGGKGRVTAATGRKAGWVTWRKP